jgi:trimethylamine--corrinoid protein Co-methyltransferase
MRPTVKFLSDELIEKIIAEAKIVLNDLGLEIHNPLVLKMLADQGCRVNPEKERAFIPEPIVDQALERAPRSFKLFDVNGVQTHDFSGLNVHFTPGSAALNILDYESGHIRRPVTADYVKYAKLVSGLPHLASQSTAFIPSDVPEKISDSYRLYLSLLYCEKPVVTGAFTAEAFTIMRDLQLAVRGTTENLKDKPLTVFSCCPTSPLKWSDVTSQNVVDCALFEIPVEFISMPLAGFMAPVTLVGTLIQHTAETLSGIVISQLTRPGTPVLYGGSPAIFDIRYETTPMGAVETQMIDCCYHEIGKHLGLPTQAYIGLSDSKCFDSQAGSETAMGAILAALAGINNISGPGMLDFESCQSLEKLVMDNEICGMALRLARGVEPREDFPSLPIFQELINEGHLLISRHTRKYLKSEHYFPGPAIDRANRSRWQEEGSRTNYQRVHEEAEKIIRQYQPSNLPEAVKNELTRLMAGEARKYGLEKLPDQT